MSLIRSLPLVDQDGRGFTLGDTLGAITVLNFIYTGCGTTCPLQTEQLASVQAALPQAARERVRFVSVTLDPAAGIPGVMRQFALEHGASLDHWAFVTGDAADMARLITFYRVLPPDPARRDQLASHYSAVHVFDARGLSVQSYPGFPVDQQRMVQELTYLATNAGARDGS